VAVADAGESSLELIDPLADGLFLLPAGARQVAQGERAQVGQEYPAGNRGPDVDALGVLHPVLPKPADETAEDFQQRLELLRSQAALRLAQGKAPLLRLHVKTGQRDRGVIEIASRRERERVRGLPIVHT